jgi:hypothetical protein
LSKSISLFEVSRNKKKSLENLQDFCARVFDKSAILEIIADFHRNIFKKTWQVAFTELRRFLSRFA